MAVDVHVLKQRILERNVRIDQLETDLVDALAKIDLLERYRDRLKKVRGFVDGISANHDPELEAIVDQINRLIDGSGV